MQMFVIKGDKETSELVGACLFLGSHIKVGELTALEQIASHPTRNRSPCNYLFRSVSYLVQQVRFDGQEECRVRDLFCNGSPFIGCS